MSPELYSDVTLADDGTVLGLRTDGDLPPVRFEAALDLLWIRWASEHTAEAADEIWSLQDGYGHPGYTPPQGWDWSGVRDSTDDARRHMLAVAQRHLPSPVVAARLGVPVATLERIVDLNYRRR